jgi:hypothetical protein
VGLYAEVVSKMLKEVSKVTEKAAPQLLSAKGDSVDPKLADVAAEVFEDIGKSMDLLPREVERIETAYKKLQKQQAACAKAAKAAKAKKK